MQIKLILESWLNPLFMAGEVLSISNYQAQVRDLLTKDIMEIEVNESFPVEAGNIATGFYLPDVRIGEHFMMVLNSLDRSRSTAARNPVSSFMCGPPGAESRRWTQGVRGRG